MTKPAQTQEEARVHVVPYCPRYPQTEIHRQLESHRFNVLVTHRQCGKTVCAVNHLLKMACLNPHRAARYFYVAPLLKQAKLIAWDYFNFFGAAYPGTAFNNSELCLTLANGAKIWVAGADNPDALRGTYADGVVLDEYAQIKKDVFTEIIRPMLLSRGGWALFTGTPKGQNQFYELYNFALRQMHEGGGQWWTCMYRGDETGVIAPEELASIKAATPDNIFRQEYLCDFTASDINVLIPIDLVLTACGRAYKEQDLTASPRVMGVDPARFGDDRAAIVCRHGLQVLPPSVFEKLDNVALAARVAEQIKAFKPDAVFIDAGRGEGVIDILRGWNFEVSEVNFGGAAAKAGQYVNKRSEIWGEMAEFLRQGGALPDSPDLRADLPVAVFDFDASNRLRLEPKKVIKARCGHSPDVADALALTFAAPVRAGAAGGSGARARFGNTNYDPFADL